MRRSYTLPDGRKVQCRDRQEAASVWEEIVGGGSYAAAATGLGPGDVILDIGAHIGLAALHFAVVAPGARILCFEPAPASFSLLRANLDRHVPDAEAVPLAVGAGPGERDLACFPRATTFNTLYPDAQDDRRNREAFLANLQIPAVVKRKAMRELDTLEHCRVRVTTVSDAVAEHHLDEIALLKIDVERGEQAVLDGIAGDLWPRVRRGVIEVHDLDGRLGSTVSRLEDLGFTVTTRQDANFTGGSVHVVVARRD